MRIIWRDCEQCATSSRSPTTPGGAVASDQFAAWSGVRSPRQARRTRPPSAGRRRLDRELVVASSQILHEAMPGDHDPGAAVLLEPTPRTQPRLQPAVVTLDVVVGIPIGAMPDRRQQLLEHRRVHRRMVGDELNERDLGRADGPLEEAAGSPPVMPGPRQSAGMSGS
jgi:hypothetical protein